MTTQSLNDNKQKECAVCTTGFYPSFSFGKDLCEKHDVCISCGKKRKDLKQTPWASREGAFQCAPCERKERKAAIKERIAKGFDHKYTDEVVCPHCGHEHSDSWEMTEGERECHECDKPFTMERDVTVTYSTEKLKAKRKKKL